MGLTSCMDMLLACPAMTDSSVAFRKHLASLLLETRLHAGIRQRDVVSRYGIVSTTCACRIEQAKRAPSLQSYIALCLGLQVSPSDLLDATLQQTGRPGPVRAPEISVECFVALCDLLDMNPSQALDKLISALRDAETDADA